MVNTSIQTSSDRHVFVACTAAGAAAEDSRDPHVLLYLLSTFTVFRGFIVASLCYLLYNPLPSSFPPSSPFTRSVNLFSQPLPLFFTFMFKGIEQHSDVRQLGETP